MTELFLSRIPPSTNRIWRPFTDAEREIVRARYASKDGPVDLEKLSGELGRTRQFLCRKAREMGLTNNKRQKANYKPHKFTPEQKAALRRSHAGLWKNRQHPRGMLGKKHSQETLEKVSAASKRSWATSKTFGVGHMSPETLDRKAMAMSVRARKMRPFTRARGGRREDIGPIWFRSSWEANYARYLNLLMRLGVVDAWEYEPETFWFDGIRRGVVSYLPDFKVTYKNDPRPEYIELKGWVQARDRTKWRRMAKYHPHIKLVIIKEKEYAALAKKWATSVPNWESSKGGGLKLGPRKSIRVEPAGVE